MPGRVLLKSLRDLRWSIVGWGLGFGLMGTIMVYFFPYVEAMPQFDELLKAYPPAMQAFFGEFIRMRTIEGFLSVELFSYALLVLGIFGITEGSAAIVGEEEKGTMDLLLGNPIPRWRVVVEKFLAQALALVGIEVLIFLGIALPVAGMGISTSYLRLIQALFDLFVGVLTLGSFSLLASALLSTRRAAALVGAALTIVSFFVNSLGKMVEWLRPFRRFTLFYYHDAGQVLTQGLNGEHIGLLLGLTLVMLIASILAFAKREIRI